MRAKKIKITYGESSAHKVHQVRVLDLDDGHGDRGLVLLGLGDLGFLLRHDSRCIESLEQQIPTKKKESKKHMSMENILDGHSFLSVRLFVLAYFLNCPLPNPCVVPTGDQNDLCPCP